VLLNALVLALVLLSLQRSRDDDRKQAVVTSQNIAQLVERDVIDSFERVDRELLLASDQFQGVAEADEAGARTRNDFLALAFSRQADFESLGMADAQGNVIYDTNLASLTRPNVVERDFFVGLRDDPQTQRIVARSRPGKGNDETGLIIARRVEKRTGGFAGVVYAAVGLDRLHSAISGVDLGQNGIVSIRGPDFGLLVRHPKLSKIDAATDPRTISNAFRQALLADPGAGSFTSKSPYDGVERTNSYRKLSGYPFYVIVGIATDDYLQPWRQKSIPIVVLAAFFSLSTFVLSELLHRFSKRKADVIATLAKQEAKFRKLLDLAPDGLVITNSEGVIVMINQRTETMFGYTRAELLGQDVEILLPERFRKNHANMVRLFAANARTRKMAAGRQLWASAKDGREFAVNISLSPIETDEGVLLTADIRDVTDVATIL
jgi:two-component system, sensor histidine kinase and response regulator